MVIIIIFVMIDFLYNSQYHHRNGTIAIVFVLAIIRKKQTNREWVILISQMYASLHMCILIYHLAMNEENSNVAFRPVWLFQYKWNLAMGSLA